MAKKIEVTGILTGTTMTTMCIFGIMVPIILSGQGFDIPPIIEKIRLITCGMIAGYGMIIITLKIDGKL